MKPEKRLIEAERLLLRLATKEDVHTILRFYSENRTYFTPFYPAWGDDFFTEEYWQVQVENNYLEFINELSLRLFLFPKENPKTIIGSINFNNFIKRAAHFCHVGYSLAEAEQGKGYMTEAMQASIRYVFQDLNMHRIMANYMPHNQRSGKLLRRLGFVVEGYARDYLLINGHWEDHILTSLTNSNWQICP